MGDSSHSFEAYFKRATSPLVVLRLLKDRPMYGYEISQAMRDSSAGRFTISVLYPVLYRLEEQGYVVAERTEVISNRTRSYYAITDEGDRYLAHTLTQYREMHNAFISIIGS